jgi:hypothetical protein
MVAVSADLAAVLGADAPRAVPQFTAEALCAVRVDIVDIETWVASNDGGETKVCVPQEPSRCHPI